MELSCVVHYNNLDTTGSIVKLSNNAHKKLLEAKEVRVNNENFTNQHLEQSGSIPDIINEDKHGIHWECYKKYTYIVSKKREASDDKSETSQKRPKRGSSEFISSEKTGVQLFPPYCFICKLDRKKVSRDKEVRAHKLAGPDSGIAIKNAARLKNDHEMLLHIEHEDLFSREFRVHDSCRRNYIRDEEAEKTERKRKSIQKTVPTIEVAPIKLRSRRALTTAVPGEEGIEHEASCVADAELPVPMCEAEINEMIEEDDLDFARDTLMSADSEHREQSTYDLETVKKEILIKVFGKKETISMRSLHQLYNDGHLEDTRYRAKLKTKLNEVYGDRIKFLQHGGKTPEVITINYGSSENLKESFDKKTIISTASKLIRDDILEYARKSKADEWPPSVTVLKSLFEAIPESVIHFLETMLKDPAHGSSDRIQRLVRSYSCDLIHGVTVGKILTLKHYLIGLGFHNMGGQKLLVQILSLLGHSVSYDTITSAETALAELSQLQSETGASSGLQPKTSDDFVYTYFWADNFNKKVESKQTSMIDSTHMIKFQEKHENSMYQDIIFRKLEKSRSKFRVRKSAEIQDLNVKKKLNPKTFKRFDNELIQFEVEVSVYLVWLVLRHVTQSEKLLPNFAGWRLSVRKFKRCDVQKTVVTYLPPINASVTEFSTIYQYLSYMQKLCFEANMPYVNITLDCGAAINAFKLIWNYPTVFDNIIIHLGDFHFMKEIFTVLGMLVKGCGFEDIVFQSNLSSSGSLNGVLNGSHYNRCWNVHEHYSEALERLFYLRFLSESSSIHDISNDHVINACDGNDSPLMTDPTLCNTIQSFTEFKQKARDGSLGKTPQFWVINYLDIIQILHLFHIAVQESDYDARLKGYLDMMPYFFGLNLTNYARYGSYYVCQMLNMEELYPGNKEVLKTHGISVQGQDKYPLRTAIDQRGEQTLNRDAKMAGGITGFALDEASVSKWTLNRSSVAEITNQLKEFAGVRCSDDVYKPSRPTEIVRSNDLTNAVMNVLTNEYINPFDKELDPKKLYNLSSGIPVTDSVADGILEVLGNGENEFNKFIKERLISDTKGFFATLPRLKIQLFSHTGRKVEVVVNGKSKTIEANSNIISRLLALSSKLNRKIDMKAALCFPLCFTPLNLAHSDGARRKTNKSDLTNILLDARAQETSYPRKQDVIAYIVDLMAMIRARPCTPATFNDLVLTIVDMIPSGYQRIDIVADTYRKDSIKDPERVNRGCAEKILVKSQSTQLPRNFNEFLQNGDNKTRLIEIFFDVLTAEREYVLSKLKCEILFYSMDGKCFAFTRNGVEQCQELSSNQEEADTKMILHCVHAMDSDEDGSVILRSHSGDADINVIASSLIVNDARRTFVDFNTGDFRKVLCLGDLDLNEIEKSALIGLHSFTGTDYASSFFRKSKKSCWKTLRNNPKFFETFSELGTTWLPSHQLQSELEEFVCLLFGSRRIKKINDLRHHLYKKKFEDKDKVIDLSLLPPCFDSLQLHMFRSAYIARRCRLSKEGIIDEPNKKNHGWDENGQIHWVKKAFPSDVELLLVEEVDTDESGDNDTDESGDNDKAITLEYVEPGDESEGSDVEEY